MASLNERLLSKFVMGGRKAEIERIADIVFLYLQTAAFFPSGRSQIDTEKFEVGSEAAHAAANNKCQILTSTL